jgi:hypothetical protein
LFCKIIWFVYQLKKTNFVFIGYKEVVQKIISVLKHTVSKNKLLLKN